MVHRLPLSTILLALQIAAAPAHAEVTPEEVWQSWATLIGRTEAVLSTDTVVREGDTLAVRGLSITYDQDPAASTVSEVNEIRFKDLGNGTVEITLSEETTTIITSPATPGIEPPIAETVTVTTLAPGARIVASGSPEALSYAYEIPTLTTSFDVVTEPPPDESGKITVTATNVAGTYRVEDADLVKTTGDVTIESAAIAVVAVPDEAGDDLEMTAAVGDIAGTFGSTLPEPGTTGDLAADLAAGMALSLDADYGATSFTMNFSESGQPATISGGAYGGKFKIALDAEALVYETASTGLGMSMRGARLPFAEAGLAIAETGFALTMPTLPTEALVPYRLMVRFIDLTMSDAVWGLFDPAEVLPREPATAILEIEGTTRLSSAGFSLESMAADELPGELHSMDLKQLLLRIAGAEVTGFGALTFDNSDEESMDGLPVPTGTIELTINGANTLMDRLIEMGLMSDDEAMGFRLMLSMFTNPAEGEDSLRSVLEFKDKGFYANGQRLQ